MKEKFQGITINFSNSIQTICKIDRLSMTDIMLDFLRRVVRCPRNGMV